MLFYNKISSSLTTNFSQQKSGLTMRNPFSPFLADVYTSSLENTVTKGHHLMFKTWFRYVDDTLTVVPNICVCVCVFQCQLIALLRASGSAQGGQMALSAIYFRTMHRFDRPYYVWDE